jgi:hypothetical protein
MKEKDKILLLMAISFLILTFGTEEETTKLECGICTDVLTNTEKMGTKLFL